MWCRFSGLVGSVSLVSMLITPAVCSAEKVVYVDDRNRRGNCVYSGESNAERNRQIIVIRESSEKDVSTLEKIGKFIGWIGGASLGFEAAGVLGFYGGVSTLLGGSLGLVCPVVAIVFGGTLIACIYAGGKIGGFFGRLVNGVLT